MQIRKLCISRCHGNPGNKFLLANLIRCPSMLFVCEMAEGIEGRSAPPLTKSECLPSFRAYSLLYLCFFDLLGQEVPERALETLARAPLKRSGGSTLGDLCEAGFFTAGRRQFNLCCAFIFVKPYVLCFFSSFSQFPILI